MKKNKVVIIQNIIPHYRKEFFENLKEKLEKDGIEFLLIYGPRRDNDKGGKGEIKFSWGISIPNKEIKIYKYTFFWKPCLKYIKDADLVIAEQANKNLLNFYMMFRRLVSKQKFAFWGHGRNRQIPRNSPENKLKNKMIKKCDWWFAYTKGVKEELLVKGFPKEKITVVQNTIDCENLQKEYRAIPIDQINALKNELEISSNNVAIYCGGIYKHKRIEFLIQAAQLVKEKIKDFQLIILGKGADVDLLLSLIQGKSWINYVGPKFSKDRVTYFRMAKLLLMPGLVGLAVIDSFVFETPMVTTEFPYHSPEIEYLENGVNGVITPDSLDSYSTGIIELFNNPAKIDLLTRGCEESANTYTLKAMVNNYYQGIKNCLSNDNINLENC